MARAVETRGSIPLRSARATACTSNPDPAATCARLMPCRCRACFKLSTPLLVTVSFDAGKGHAGAGCERGALPRVHELEQRTQAVAGRAAAPRMDDR